MTGNRIEDKVIKFPVRNRLSNTQSPLGGKPGELKIFQRKKQRIGYATEREVYETCGRCKEITDIRKDTPIDERMFYVECAGQLCSDCYGKVYTPENMRKAEEWFTEYLDRLKGDNQ